MKIKLATWILSKTWQHLALALMTFSVSAGLNSETLAQQSSDVPSITIIVVDDNGHPLTNTEIRRNYIYRIEGQKEPGWDHGPSQTDDGRFEFGMSKLRTGPAISRAPPGGILGRVHTRRQVTRDWRRWR